MNHHASSLALCTGGLLLLGASLSPVPAASDRPGREREPRLARPSAIEDRAQNVHTVNKLGQTITNLGQFYPFGGVLPAGRWPLGTDHDQIYKMNVLFGRPNNVISTRARNVKEWDAVPGFHFPDSGKAALSSDPLTWPRDASGTPYWPVRTADGRDSIVSQEDGFAVYRDLTNNVAAVTGDPNQRLNITVRQTSYAWSTSRDDDFLFVAFEFVNDTSVVRDSLYFGLYCDFDAGGIVNDYFDDKWGLDLARQLFYIYDADGISVDWEAGAAPFHLGVVLLETPRVNGIRPGLTDWHYSSDGDSPWGDVIEEDQIMYEWMSSSDRLRSDRNWPNLFHGTDTHFDDVSLIPPAGDRLDAIAASGPYTVGPGESLTFVIALVAGEDLADLNANVDRLTDIHANGFQLIPPPKVSLRPQATEGIVELVWSNENELTYTDPASGRTLVQEYRIYKTEDPTRQNWGDPVAVIPQDSTLSGVVSDAYRWVDSAGVRNYFYYSYAVTTYDVDGIESGRAFLPADQTVNENTAELRPLDAPRASLDAIKVVPNPYVISAAWERKRLGDPLLGEPIRDLAFTNLPGQCTITIYTLDGDRVATLEHSDGTGTAFWDIRSGANQLVATGIYFFHVSSPQGERIGKFAVVR